MASTAVTHVRAGKLQGERAVWWPCRHSKTSGKSLGRAQSGLTCGPRGWEGPASQHPLLFDYRQNLLEQQRDDWTGGPCLSPPPGGLGPPRAGAGVGRWHLGCDASGCVASSPPCPVSLEKPLSLPGRLGESRSPGPSGAASRLLPPAPSGPRLLFLQRRLHPQPPGVTLAAFRPAPRLPDEARPPLLPPCLWPKSCPWAPHPRPSAPKSQPP